ncbi:MAG: helix-turn-helix domain-containing protein [Chloroflexi bacterium]|nr:helix-turn-helix domain-containing protein [Chloroflexota bacterium]
MGRRPQEPLRPLTTEEQEGLEVLIKAQSARRDQVRRATALQAVAQDHSYIRAAERAGYTDAESVSRLVRRFNRRGLGAVRIAAGRGRALTYGPAERGRVVATAQRAPDREEDGTATWSLSMLERALRQGGLPRIGRTTIRRVLRAAGSSYQRTRTWCPTGTAVRRRKDGAVRVSDPETEKKRGASNRRIG